MLTKVNVEYPIRAGIPMHVPLKHWTQNSNVENLAMPISCKVIGMAFQLIQTLFFYFNDIIQLLHKTSMLSLSIAEYGVTRKSTCVEYTVGILIISVRLHNYQEAYAKPIFEVENNYFIQLKALSKLRKDYY